MLSVLKPRREWPLIVQLWFWRRECRVCSQNWKCRSSWSNLSLQWTGILALSLFDQRGVPEILHNLESESQGPPPSWTRTQKRLPKIALSIYIFPIPYSKKKRSTQIQDGDCNCKPHLEHLNPLRSRQRRHGDRNPSRFITEIRVPTWCDGRIGFLWRKHETLVFQRLAERKKKTSGNS